MSTKRVRTAQPEYIEFKVHIPSEPAPDIVIASSGKGFRPKYAIQPVRFASTTRHTFSKLWMRFPDYMLYKEDESEPFTDFEAPLASIEARKFVAREWTPEYERQRLHLTKLGYSHNLELLEREIEAAAATLEEMRKRRAVLASRIETIGQTIIQSATCETQESRESLARVSQESA